MTGEGASDEVEDREGERTCPVDAPSEGANWVISLSLFLLASTSSGNRRGRSSRMIDSVCVCVCVCVGVIKFNPRAEQSF